MAHAPEQPGQDASIPVPQEVLDGIRAVQRSGRTNMLDRPAVMRIADQLGFAATVLWIHNHPSEYARGVFHGFRAEPEPGDHFDPGAPDA